MRYPFLIPSPARLSEHLEELRAIESSTRFTNFGPVNERFESEVVDTLFAGRGAAATVGNATLGLMLAIRRAIEGSPQRRFAILPSFTFAATAEAALWCGLEPLFCDVAPETWVADSNHIEKLVREHADQVAVVVPYATFGNDLDLRFYDELTERHGIPVVIDAAASLGSLTANGAQFGTGSRHTFVFSMHATKTFATGEAGLVYSDDVQVAKDMHQLSNFGFDARRMVVRLGMNAKLPEYGALLCLAKLRELETIVEHRSALARTYVRTLPLEHQRSTGSRCAFQFFPAAVPPELAARRDALIEALHRRELECRKYFDPPLHQQPFFAATATRLPATEDAGRRAVSLPIHDAMSVADVEAICTIISEALAEVTA